jgi:protein-disulfide isomerase/uncharacterized membrane protein
MAKKRPVGRPASRLQSYRPIIDRLVFGVALLGVLVTVHLYIQQERGFDRGCLGFSTSAQVEAAFDCSIVTESAASNLFGVSNAIWGILFYLAVAAIAFAVVLASRNRILKLKRLRAGVVTAGFLYTLYLVYFQIFELGDLCALCLISAGIATTLFALIATDFFTKPAPPPMAHASQPDQSRRQNLALMGTLSVLVVLLAGADFFYFNSLEVADAPAPVLWDGEPRSAAIVDDDQAADCGYDPEKQPVQGYASLVTSMDPYKGSPDAPVTVIEYFDPNCPHCATAFPVLEELAETHGDKAWIVYKPFVLWQHSLAQSEALYAAAQEGKFFEMMELQFANQQPSTGFSIDQLRAFADHIGMNPNLLAQRIESGIYRNILGQTRQRGIEAGVNSVPAILINGRFVTSESRTVACLGRLVDEAAN